MEEGGSLVVKELRVANKGWEFLELSDAEQATAEETNPNTLTLTLTLTLALALTLRAGQRRGDARHTRLPATQARDALHPRQGRRAPRLRERQGARAPRRPRASPPATNARGPCAVLTSGLPRSCRS